MARSSSEDEAAAIAAAISRFRAETAPASGGEEEAAIGPWQRAALLEGVSAKGIVEDTEGGSRWLS